MVEARKMTSRPIDLANLAVSLLAPLTVIVSLNIAGELIGVRFDQYYVFLTVIAFLLSFIVFREADLHHSWREGGIKSHIRDLVGAWMVIIAVLLFLGYATKTSAEFSRRALVLWIFLAPMAVFGMNILLRSIMNKYLNNESHRRSAVVVGANDLGHNLKEEFSLSQRLNVAFKGFFDDRSQQRLGLAQTPELLLGNLSDLYDYVRANRIEIVYITLPMLHEKRIVKALDELSDTTVSIYFVPDLFVFDLIQARIDDVNGIPVLALCESPFSGMQGLLKRISDVVLSTFILMLVAPFMMFIALIIKMTSKGPVLFKQERYGLDGEPIKVYKFRTMAVCEDGADVRQATRNDSRVTRFGAFLRRTSLDELPQFFNVLQGRMSVVGPRPHAVAHNEEYRKLIKGYMMRHKVRPGITGWAQVHGLRGETETVDKMKSRVQYDLDYLRRWSIGLDLMIIYRTIYTVIKDPNAY